MPRARFAAAVLAVVVAQYLSSVGLQAQTETALNSVLDLTNVITARDPTTLRTIRYVGELERRMWIIRDGRWDPGEYDAHVFDVSYDIRRVEFQIHSEIGDRTAARAEVDLYAPVFGQLPAALMEHLREVEVYESPAQYYMGARRCSESDSPCIVGINTTISANANVMGRGLMEEHVIHEAVHVSWDHDHLSAPGWQEAQRADPGFISHYARDYPDREDLADTAVAWFAVRYRPAELRHVALHARHDGAGAAVGGVAAAGDDARSGRIETARCEGKLAQHPELAGRLLPRAMRSGEVAR